MLLFKILLFLLLACLALLAMNYKRGIPVERLYKKYLTPESKILNVEGMPLHYRKTGQGPVLLLLHGVASSLHTWKYWHEDLSADFTVVSIDLPGFALTGPHPEGDYSVEMYMRCIDELLAYMEVDKLYIAGNSFGGFLSWKYALHQPEKVEKLALLDAAGIISTEKVKEPGFRLIMHPLTKGLAQRITPRFMLALSLKNMYGNPDFIKDGDAERYFDLLVREGNRAAFSTVMCETLWFDAEEQIVQLQHIQQPTLILWGSKDRILRRWHADIFNKEIPNSQLIVYDGVGHLPMEEAHAQSAADLKLFLDKK